MIEGEIHINRGTNREIKPYPFPCPNCGSLTYLGKFIPTVSAFHAEYYGWSFHCHNEACDPIYEKHDISEEGYRSKIYYDLIDSGAYWADEDECYYTPQCPRE
jgi:hypothetical protein